MANIKQTPSTQARLGKTGHDLSHRFIFSSTVGQLLPIYVDELIPGDHVKISADMFTRTVPLETPPFTRVTEHIDYFFVPMQQLYTFFGDFITGVNDIQTTLITNGSDVGVNGTPFVDAESILASLLNLRYEYDEFGVQKACNAYRLLDYLGYSYNFIDVFSFETAEDIPTAPQHLKPLAFGCLSENFL
jgi:Capsid protein (F protein).